MNWIDVADRDSLEEGKWTMVEVKKRSIGLLLNKGTIHAVFNYCPHSGAEICKGRVTGRVICRDDKVDYDPNLFTLRCPWHHWEFDLETGKPVVDMKGRLKVYPVKVENNRVWIQA